MTWGRGTEVTTSSGWVVGATGSVSLTSTSRTVTAASSAEVSTTAGRASGVSTTSAASTDSTAAVSADLAVRGFLAGVVLSSLMVAVYWRRSPAMVSPISTYSRPLTVDGASVAAVNPVTRNSRWLPCSARMNWR